MVAGEKNDVSVLLAGVIVSSAAGILGAMVLQIWNRRYTVYQYMGSIYKHIRIARSPPPQVINVPVQAPVPPAPPAPNPVPKKAAQQKKSAISIPKIQVAPKHNLELNSFKGHGDVITSIAFTFNGRALASACADRLVRVFKLDDVTSKNHQPLRLNVPAGCIPAGVVFGEGTSKVVVATQDLSGSGLLMFGSAEGKAAASAREQGKLPPPEIKWRKENIHDKKSLLTCVGARCKYGSGDGSAIVVTSSEGTDIKVWSAETGKCLGTVDTNQLKNTMATVSPDGRFLTAAAFTADVKVWEIRYGKDGQVRDITKVMMLKGHKTAVTWVCFTSDSQRMITASKDGTIRIWNINVRYHLDEDPKCLKTFSITNDEGQYEMIAVSLDDKVLAATMGTTLTFLSTEDGTVLDTVTNAHSDRITCAVWSPQPDQSKLPVLATASVDKKIKLWRMP